MRLLLPVFLALVLVPAALSADRPTQTISGSVSANSGASITVTSGERSMTCLVPGAKAQAAIARWGVGARAAMACTQDGDRLLLARLTRLGVKEGTATAPPTTTAPAPTPAPTPTTTDKRDARGIVVSLSSDAVTVKPDAGWDALRCRVTPAADSVSAAAKLALGLHVGIVCRRDGDSYVLSGTTSIG
jgi:hypothetical protein